MKRTLIALATSAAVFSFSTGAFAQASTPGNAGGGGPAVTEPQEKTIGAPRKTETENPGAMPSPNATDVTGSTGSPDATQSKRKDTAEPAQSGSK